MAIIRIVIALALAGGFSFAGSACLRFQQSPFDSSALESLLVQLQVVAAAGAGSGSGTTTPVTTALTFGEVDSNSMRGGERGLNNPKGITISGNTIIVADRDNMRVPIMTSLPTADHAPFNVTLAQPGITNTSAQVFIYPTSSTALDRPSSVATDGTRVAVSDTQNHRVLIWNTIPTSSNQPADVVVGQPNFTSNTAGVTATTLNSPDGVTFCGSKLAVADTTNNRLLIWNSIPTSNGVAADVVLGQIDFVSNAGGAPTATNFRPAGIHCAGSNLWVADLPNNRVLRWNPIPTANNTAATLVLGQPGFTSGAPSLTNTGMASPEGVFEANGRLVVADTGHNRVLIWAPVPTTNGIAASRVQGQPNFTSSAIDNPSLGLGLEFPRSVALDASTRLYVVDRQNHRIAIWDAPESGNGVAISRVIGQPSSTFARSFSNEGGASDVIFRAGSSVAISGNQLYISNPDEHRVIGWSSVPTASGQFANLLLGQVDFTSVQANRGGPTANNTFNTAVALCANSSQFFATDQMNNRVLVWNTSSPGDQAPPNFVLGQATFTTSGVGTTGTTLSNPGFMACNDSKLLLSDINNHRVLVFNLPITANQQSATIAIGQASLVTGGSGTTSAALNQPSYLSLLSDGKLLVSDGGNNRVLVFNSVPTASGTAADLVIGHTTFTLGTANAGLGSVNAAGLQLPGGHALLSTGQLLIADGFNSRILIWNSFPTSNGQAADRVFGQTSLTASLPNQRQAVSRDTLFVPGSLKLVGSDIYIVDAFNQRIYVRAAADIAP